MLWLERVARRLGLISTEEGALLERLQRPLTSWLRIITRPHGRFQHAT